MARLSFMRDQDMEEKEQFITTVCHLKKLESVAVNLTDEGMQLLKAAITIIEALQTAAAKTY